jgi:hypothetical protein
MKYHKDMWLASKYKNGSGRLRGNENCATVASLSEFLQGRGFAWLEKRFDQEVRSKAPGCPFRRGLLGSSCGVDLTSNYFCVVCSVSVLEEVTIETVRDILATIWTVATKPRGSRLARFGSSPIGREAADRRENARLASDQGNFRLEPAKKRWKQHSIP